MTLESRLIEMLKKHEGVRFKPYLDTVGKTTIGIGRNLDDVGINMDEAEHMLRNDIDKVISKANKLPFWNDLTDNRKLVILDMAFNMGWDELMSFKNTLRSIENKNYVDASNRMLESKWASQVHGRAITLAGMMRDG